MQIPIQTVDNTTNASNLVNSVLAICITLQNHLNHRRSSHD